MEEPFFQRTVEKRSVVGRIPVENEGIGTVGNRRINIIHSLRLLFVQEIAQGHIRLQMTGKPRSRVFHQFPFIPARTVKQCVSGIAGVVMREIITANIFAISYQFNNRWSNRHSRLECRGDCNKLPARHGWHFHYERNG